MPQHVKSQQQKVTSPLAVLAYLLREHPQGWTPAELATVLGTSRRSTERACAKLAELKLVESRRGAYGVAHEIVQNIIGTQRYYQKQVEKDIKTARVS